jgi:hypothetical protein
MATAMVAITFGLARTMLDKQISSYVIFVTIIAADLGLLVLVAQKKSDIYRILHVIILTFGSIIQCFFTIESVTRIINPDPVNPISEVWLRMLVTFLIGASLMVISIFLSRKIEKLKKKEIERD